MAVVRRRGFRSGGLRTDILPILVWIAVLALVVVLFRRRAQRFAVMGLAQGRVHQVAATCAGRLKEVPVQLFERVSRGQTLVVVDTVLDGERLQAELDTASAEIEHLKAELVSTEQRLKAEATNRQTDWVAAHRRFSVDIENARLRVLELKAQLEADRLALEGLEVDNKAVIMQRLSEPGDGILYELQQAKARSKILAGTIQENEQLLVQAQSDLTKAQQRLSEFAARQPQHPSVDAALDIIRKAVRVQEKRVEELQARRELLVLGSPFDGVISRLDRGPGEAIMAGDPILAVAETKPSEVIAYATASQLNRIKERIPVELIKSNDPTLVVRSQVVNLGANVELVPQQLWRSPNIPQWGRPVLIKIPPGFELVPGEVVGIRGL